MAESNLVTPDTQQLAWGKNVLSTLGQQGRSSAWLARNIGMDRTQLSHILNGDCRYKVTEDLQDRIAELLGVPKKLLWPTPPDAAEPVSEKVS